ncbi:MAG: Cache 3/Cache 2 fusion domain-containing protein [Kiritimatiellae bacterium]|nr:Cache 3/Cache 2 fusion domain-containing protein [Kiritimatiellia bacterium]
MKWTYKKKIILLAMVSAVLPIAVMSWLIVDLEKDVVSRSTSKLEEMARTNVAQIANDVYGLCVISDKYFSEQLDQSVVAADEILYGSGPVSFGDPLEWMVRSDDGEGLYDVTLPALCVDGFAFESDNRMDRYAPVVDDVLRMTGMDCTLFQRLNEQGDMLRVASTLSEKKDPTRRALGTVYPAVLPDGTPNEATLAVLRGERSSSFETVLDNAYLVCRLPVSNVTGEVIGMLGVGRKVNAMEFLKSIIQNTRVGARGYVWVVRADGPDRGRAIISQDGVQNGRQLWDARDASGRYYMREMITRATQSEPGAMLIDRLDLQSVGETSAQSRLVAFTWFEPWQWVIGASAYEEEYYALNDRIRDETRESLAQLLGAGLALLLVMTTLAVVIAVRMARPLGRINQVARLVAEGNLREALTLLGGLRNTAEREPRDEVEELTGSFRIMTDHLAALLGQVQKSGLQVTTSATEIAAASRQLEATSVEQAASTRAVSQTTSSITDTAQSLVGTMDEVNGMANQTAGTAETGREKMRQMQEAMQQLVRSTEFISSKLAVINEKAGRISGVVTTINAISDQTNLLSPNAAIEAEKAGEHGRGFVVVAREITRLADQTATATQDIEYMVKEMQSSVSSGVMAMDKFGEGVRLSVGEVADIAEQLGGIIEQVRALSPQFELVQQGMSGQVDGARQISDTMRDLSSAADQSRDSLHEFQHVTEQLNEAIHGLQQEVARFSI